ncbi:hypothetical protein ACQY0O_006615 [Thecaphora frezii]
MAAVVAGPSSSPLSTLRTKDKKSKSSGSGSSSSSKKHKPSKRHSSSYSHAHADAVQDPLHITSLTSASATASNDADLPSAFETMYPTLNLAIPPVWMSNPYAAFSDLMDTLVMRYVPQLSGVLITHRPLRFLAESAKFYADNASPSAPIEFECIVWRPKIGQKLEGTITLSSPSHVSLLLYGTFNASIPASHLKQDEWEFVIDAEADVHVHGMGADRGLGQWRSKRDGSRLGGEDGKLRFTTISMMVANHILSLHGSLLDDPFSVPAPTEDASYLAKSLSDANVVGFAANAKKNKRNATDASGGEEAKPQNRRVRWEDQDSESDDAAKGDGKAAGSHTTFNDDDEEAERDKDEDNEAVEALPLTPSSAKDEEKPAKGSKRKSRKSLDNQDDDAVVDESGAAKSRDKKKRKKDKSA